MKVTHFAQHLNIYISVNFSSCFYNVEGDFLLNKINFVGGDKLSPVFKHGFLRSEENVFPVFLYTHFVYIKYWENIFFRPEEALCI